MGGIVIDIWEKSNFFGSFRSQKVPKTRFLFRKALRAPLLLVGLTLPLKISLTFLLQLFCQPSENRKRRK